MLCCAVQASSVASVSFGPHMLGMDQHAQHARGYSTVAVTGASDSSGGPTTPDLVPMDGAGAGSGAGAVAAAAKAGDSTQPALRSGEAMSQMGAIMVATKSSAETAAGAVEVQPPEGAGAGKPDAGAAAAGAAVPHGPGVDAAAAARMRELFHQPTDLGTLEHTDAWRTLPSATCAAPQRPGQGASMKERLAYIGRQLDAFGSRGVILKQYEKLGGDDRCYGGAPASKHMHPVWWQCVVASGCGCLCLRSSDSCALFCSICFASLSDVRPTGAGGGCNALLTTVLTNQKKKSAISHAVCCVQARRWCNS